ncbi:hypothetical protein [Marinicellulosiphila megalodicopiae]|uniref:hypothetical protein n=1 Tax=Marinicellulosiphila megalodicopiae TaxID=2724896 RepID=UPI003BAED1FA
MLSNDVLIKDILRHPLLIMGGFILVAVNALLLFLIVLPSINSMKAIQFDQRQAMMSLIAQQVAPLIVSRDSVSLSDIAINVIERPILSEIKILDDKQRIIAQAQQRQLVIYKVTDSYEVNYLSQNIGVIYFTFDDQFTQKYKNKVIIQFILFNLLSFSFIVFLVYRNDLKNRQRLKLINNKLATVLVDWQPKTGTQLQQIEQVIDAIENNQILSVSQSIIQQKQHHSFLKMMQQWRNISDKGFYTELCLLNVRCINSDTLSRQFDAYTLNYLWETYEYTLYKLTQLYRATQLPEGSMLAFGMEHEVGERDIELAASNCVCAAKVFEQTLEILKKDEHLDDNKRTLFNQAKFAITISFGTAFVATTNRLGVNLPMVAGDVYNDMQSISSAHVGDEIWVNSELFSNQSVGEIVEASVVRDTNRFDGSEIEIWQLDNAKKSYQSIFNKQAQTILTKYHGRPS